ncbi:arsenical-resistance protein [Bacterioplanes sanyensis]|uniref:Arsenical-resistance protein n=1 Tax=Bacterioplanes sanyensis TaxID=1249553 RepID=A0A222FP83_9GAMM|nr:ACR3 family arsenite efflux transporter [Bacterioplanes sanyensis]ASP40324.1 arsenical-resistance protein [Bacterioplanes sanyensis]
MGIFERYLSLWVALAMALGVVLGSVFPSLFSVLADFQYAQVNLLVAILIWCMIYPMMVQIDFRALAHVSKQPQGLLLTVVVNWLIKPFSMAFLGWLFFKVVFAGWVDPQTAEEYIAGMILLGVAPCTAMVFVWSQLTRGDANYTLLQVSLNDVIMIFAFAPLAGLLLGLTDVVVPWQTLLLSVLLYVLIPLIAGVLTRYLCAQDEQKIQRLETRLKPWSVVSLLLTVLLLFGFQANTLLAQPLVIAMITVPLLLQTYGIFVLAYAGAYWLKLPHRIAAPACLIGTSNFFELAVAVAIAVFGLHSGAALATVVGVLVEVPVMLSLVAVANRTRHWFPGSTTAIKP